ncbi:MAG: S1 family peptidase [Nitrosopumilus sp.]|nr:S1 family peptidase [Nitrosopumilus sp.]
MTKQFQYFALVGLFSILLASGITVNSSALPDHVPDIAKVKVGQFTQTIIQTDSFRAVIQPLYTTYGDPADYLTSPGGALDGTGLLILNHPGGATYGCTGGLLWTGEHVLTAAHCVTDSFGNMVLQSGTVTFEGDSGIETIAIDAAATKVHNKWNGDVIKGNDVAVLKLAYAPTADITRYQIDRDGSDDIGAVVEKVGYGLSGNGNDGTTIGFGDKRNGQNQYDDVADTMLKALGLKAKAHFVPGSVLQYDFDNGIPSNDAFGFFFNNNNLGLGSAEVNSASGDSGGPAIYNGNIIGITSYGVTLTFNDGTTSDVNGILDSSFGEFSGDTRVSTYVAFIDDSVNGGTNDGSSVGEPKCTKGMQKRGLC